MRWQLLIPNMVILNPKTRRATKPPAAPATSVSAVVGIIFAGEPCNRIFAVRAGAEYHRAQTQFQSNPDDPAAAWQFARVCFDFTDFVTTNARRAELANQGIAACRQLLACESNSTPVHYYLAVDSRVRR